TLFSITAWAMVIPAAVITRKSAPQMAFSILWFLCGHLMESTIIALEVYFEHRNYLAMLGPLLLVVCGLAKLQLRLAVPIFILWAAVACFSTASVALVWDSAEVMADVRFPELPGSVHAIHHKAGTLTSQASTDAATTFLEEGY